VRVLVTGAGGQLGRSLATVFAASGDEVIAAGHANLDVCDRDAVLGAITSLAPDAVVHAAAWTDVDACESDPGRAYAVNALGTRHVADAARRVGAHLCYVSTDYVFDGALERAYVEWDAPNPLSVYGWSKLGGENEALSLTAAQGATIVRTSWLAGSRGASFVATMVRLARSTTEPVRVVCDQRGSPTFTPDLAAGIRRLVAARLPGLFHVTNQGGGVSRYDLAAETFELAGGDPHRVLPIATADLDPPRPAPRPPNAVLDNAAWRGSGLPLLADYHEPLERLVKELCCS